MMKRRQRRQSKGHPSQPTKQPNSQTARHPAKQPDTQTPNQPPSQPANHPPIWPCTLISRIMIDWFPNHAGS
ncbi:hypothetical protein Pmani_037776 [Petrolisthes manimaculis]|uniref:Uncharacterized protein n=1 Tax=Petrolisthes manimaculis TaxID=1843537 RepID=A0AAE1NFN2_9EUCA|nr:hypothetical protein Pmani_037776 [Petrolisthes manimaculis]